MRRLLMAACLGIVAGAAHAHPQQLTDAQKQAAAQAVAVLNETVPKIAEIEPPYLQAGAFSEAAETYARAGSPERARQTIRAALEFFRKSESATTFDRSHIALDAVRLLVNWGELAEAQAAAEEFLEARNRPHAFRLIAFGHARAGNWKAAFRIAGEIPEPYSRDDAYRSVALACLNRKDFVCATSAAEAMTDSPQKVEMLGRVAVARGRANAAAAGEDLNEARRIAQSLSEDQDPYSQGGYHGCVPRAPGSSRDFALRRLAESQAATGDFASAQNSLNGIRDQDGRENALVSMTSAAASRRNFELAQTFAGEIARHECRSVALSMIAIQQYRAGEVQSAQLTIQQIPEARERVRALVSIARMQSARDRETAASTFALASLTAGQVSAAEDRFDALLLVISRQIRAGFGNQALPSLLTARDIAVAEMPKKNPNRDWQRPVNELATWFAEVGELQAATETAKKVRPVRTQILPVARGATRGGHLSVARAWADSLPDPAERVLARIGIAMGILDHARIKLPAYLR